MQSYVESKLTAIHRANFGCRVGEKCATLCTGVALALILPYLHIGWYRVIFCILTSRGKTGRGNYRRLPKAAEGSRRLQKAN